MVTQQRKIKQRQDYTSIPEDLVSLTAFLKLLHGANCWSHICTVPCQPARSEDLEVILSFLKMQKPNWIQAPAPICAILSHRQAIYYFQCVIANYALIGWEVGSAALKLKLEGKRTNRENSWGSIKLYYLLEVQRYFTCKHIMPHSNHSFYVRTSNIKKEISVSISYTHKVNSSFKVIYKYIYKVRQFWMVRQGKYRLNATMATLKFGLFPWENDLSPSVTYYCHQVKISFVLFGVPSFWPKVLIVVLMFLYVF